MHGGADVFTLSDVTGLLTAFTLYVPLLFLPGYAIARVLGGKVFVDDAPGRRLIMAMLAAFAVLPVITANLSIWFGLKTCIAVLLATAVWGAFAMRRDGVWQPTLGVMATAGLWMLLVVSVWIDIEWNGQLHMSLLATDAIKHAAITRAMVDSGVAPPSDPFFFREGHASFYYFYFVPSALAETLASGLADSRAAVGGLIVWTGIAVAGLPVLLYERAGFRMPRRGSIAPLLVGLMSVAGLQMISVVLMALQRQGWDGQSNWNNEMVVGWIISLVWVPHHVCAVIASWMAFVWLIDAHTVDATNNKRQIAALIFCAGAGFASAAGLSIWVTFGLVATAAAWAVLLLVQHRYRLLGLLVAAGVVSLVLAAPYLIDILGNRAGDGPVIEFAIRRFSMVASIGDILERFGVDSLILLEALRFYLLPLNYLLEMGVVALGAYLFWRKTPRAVAHATDVGQLITISAVAAILVGSLLRSTIGNNDLGWRVVLFAQLSGLLWLTHLMMPVWQRAQASAGVVARFKSVPRVLIIFGALGLTGTVYDLVFLRFWHPLEARVKIDYDARVQYELREASLWMNAHVPMRHVVQHNPDVVRAFAFALYGRHPVGIADLHNGILLGASLEAIQKRLAEIIPVFSTGMTKIEAARVLRSHGIDVLVVTKMDPIWGQPNAWLNAHPTIYQSANVRIFNVGSMLQ